MELPLGPQQPEPRGRRNSPYGHSTQTVLPTKQNGKKRPPPRAEGRPGLRGRAEGFSAPGRLLVDLEPDSRVGGPQHLSVPWKLVYLSIAFQSFTKGHVAPGRRGGRRSPRGSEVTPARSLSLTLCQRLDRARGTRVEMVGLPFPGRVTAAHQGESGQGAGKRHRRSHSGACLPPGPVVTPESRARSRVGEQP